jgi:hypothetical protein
MNKLHVLPTDKPSRLLYNFTLESFCIQKEKDEMYINDGKVSGADFWSIEKANNNGFRYVNIYITSDEEIKEGNWVKLFVKHIDKEWVHKVTKEDLLLYPDFNNEGSKIILTTDQSLDGVQAIDDEFLEWFVKNSSCEEVEVETKDLEDIERELNIYGHDIGLTDDELRDWIKSGGDYYKIIIPKEEPKQYKCTECNWLGLFNEMKNEQDTDYDQYCCPKCNNVMYDCRFDNWYLEEPKQETLEEATERYVKDKWEPAQEETKESFIDGYKLAQKILYSEEEVLILLHERDVHNMHYPSTFNKGWKTPKEWFKKK